MNNLIPTLKYAWLTMKHKAFVFRAGLRTKAPIWRLLVHDLSKFGPSELHHYGRQFYGDKSDPLGFEQAWNHHQKVNKHHWEYWVPHTCHGRGIWEDGKPLPMPEGYVREMVADWMGASRAYDGHWPKSCSEWPWFIKSFPKKVLHFDTRLLVIKVLREMGMEPEKLLTVSSYQIAVWREGVARNGIQHEISMFDLNSRFLTRWTRQVVDQTPFSPTFPRIALL